MALVIADRVKETTSSTGTTTFNLAGAVTGFRTFVAGAGDGSLTYYAAFAGTTEWEVGMGVVTDAATDTLTRAVVLASSNSGALTNFSTSPTVWGDAPAALITGSMDNRLINGDFLFDQRSEGASSDMGSVPTGAPDNWLAATTAGGKATIQRTATSPPANFLYSVLITSSTAWTIPAGGFGELYQYIEGSYITDFAWGSANAKPIVVSFWVKSSLTGAFTFNVFNSAANRVYVTTYTINAANTWEYKTLFIPGDTTGTWLTTTGIGLAIGFDIGSGSTLTTSTTEAWQAGFYSHKTAAVNLTATNGATLNIGNVRLRPGTCDVPYIARPYTVELNLCQRYICKTFSLGTAPAQNAGITGAITVKNPIALGDPSEWWQFPARMRANPAITTYNPSAANANWRDITAAADATVSVDPSSTIGQTGVLIATSGTVTALGDILAIHALADASL